MNTVKVCSVCSGTLLTVQKCGKCLSTFYCSRNCQLADWKNHKHICDIPTTPIAKLEMVIKKIRCQPRLLCQILDLLHNKNDTSLLVVKCIYDDVTDQCEFLDPEVMTTDKYLMLSKLNVEPEIMKLQIILVDMALDLIGCCTVSFTEITKNEHTTIFQPVLSKKCDTTNSYSSDSSIYESDDESNSG